jgi:hypothetical protein
MQSAPSPDAMQRGFEELAEVLAQLVDRPDEVTLVVPVRLAEAVVRRSPHSGYHTDRGKSAVVAARTMQLPDGRIDVIIDPNLILDTNDAGQPTWTAAGMPRLNRMGLKHLRRTVVHESQHAVMDQRNSGYDQYDVPANTDAYPRWDYAVSVKMCDEHRAEWNAIRLTSRTQPTPKDITDALSHLGNDLAVAHARSQTSALTPQDIDQLRDDVYNACAAFWTWMAYWSAQFRDGVELADVGPDIAELALWKRYVGPTWNSLGQALAALPVADLSTPADTLRHAAGGMAGWVAESLRFIGFRNVKGAVGDAFYIDRHDFPAS